MAPPLPTVPIGSPQAVTAPQTGYTNPEWGPGQVAVVAADGTFGSVPADQLPRALAGGMKLWTPELEFAGKKGVLLAAMLGGARGMSFGLSDASVVGVGGMDPKVLKAIEDAHPGVAIGTELIPQVAVGIVSGGAAPAGELLAGGAAKVAGRFGGTAVGKLAGSIAEVAGSRTAPMGAAVLEELAAAGTKPGLLTKLITKGLVQGTQAAAETVPFAIGDAVSEKALGDPREVGEIVAANAFAAGGLSFVVGAALGGAGELFSSGMKSVSSRVSKRVNALVKNKQGLIDARDAFFAQEVGLTKANLRDFKPGATDALFDAGYMPDGSAIISGTEKRADDIAARLKKAVEHHGKLAGAPYAKLDKTATGALDKAFFDGVNEKAAEVLKKEALGPTDMAKAKAAFNNWATEINKELENGYVSWEKTWKMQRGMIAKGIDKGEGAGVARSEFLIGKQLRDALYAEVEKHLPRDIGKQWARSRDVYAKLVGINDSVQEVLKAPKLTAADDAKNFLSRWSSLTGYRTGFGMLNFARNPSVGGLAGFAVGGPIGAAAGAGMSLAAAKLTPSAAKMAVWADQLARKGLLASTVISVQQQVNTAMELLARVARGTVRPVVADAPVIAKLRTDMKERDNRRLAQKVALRAKQIVASPDALAQHVGDATVGMTDIAPETSVSTIGAMTRAVQYIGMLSEKLIPHRTMLQPMLDDPNDMLPSHQDAQKFLVSVGAALDPVSVAGRIVTGTATRDEIDALKTAWPTFADALTKRVVAEAAQSKVRLTDSQQISIGMLMGRDVAALYSPMLVLRSQQVYNSPDSARAMGGINLSLSKLGDVDGRYLTNMQRLESNKKR